jgi:hypothetical protein
VPAFAKLNRLSGKLTWFHVPSVVRVGVKAASNVFTPPGNWSNHMLIGAVALALVNSVPETAISAENQRSLSEPAPAARVVWGAVEKPNQ